MYEMFKRTLMASNDAVLLFTFKTLLETADQYISAVTRNIASSIIIF